jgi:outer membrane murein-binding lipoprotein Lpp
MEGASMIKLRSCVLQLSAVSAAVLGGLSLSACASTEYVDEHITEVNTHLSAVEARATAADQKADQALSAAQAAQAAAAQANQRIDSLSARVDSLQEAPPPPLRTPRG